MESKSAEDSKTPDARPRAKKPSAASIRAGGRSAARARLSSPEREKDAEIRTQREVISAWIDDPNHPATETCRYSLELYAQLNDSEFAYVSELQVIYDKARCFFLQWILDKEIKELVNFRRSKWKNIYLDPCARRNPEEHDRRHSDCSLPCFGPPKTCAGNDSEIMDLSSPNSKSPPRGSQTTCPYPTTGVFVPGNIGGPDVCTGDHGL